MATSSWKAVVKRLMPIGLFRSMVPYWHWLVAVVSSLRYGLPARDMHVIGVTGTNGKTSTSFLIHKMMAEAGLDVALMTTVAYGVRDEITPQIAHMTTASAPLLNRRIAEFRRQGAKWLVLETTSHALAQHRTWGIPFEIAVMTNVTHEHLDYHGSFEHYLASKRKMFEIANRHGRRLGIVNAEDDSADEFASVIENHLSYGIETGDIQSTLAKNFQ